MFEECEQRPGESKEMWKQAMKTKSGKKIETRQQRIESVLWMTKEYYHRHYLD
jgi:hypothetical protein